MLNSFVSEESMTALLYTERKRVTYTVHSLTTSYENLYFTFHYSFYPFVLDVKKSKSTFRNAVSEMHGR
jgi:hypothetical protein